MSAATEEGFTLDHLERCFGGAIPAVIATVDADGVPNITYVSRAHRVDDQRLALSNQFMSKTASNIAVNRKVCLLLLDPVTHDEYRLSIVYERTEARGGKGTPIVRPSYYYSPEGTAKGDAVIKASG